MKLTSKDNFFKANVTYAVAKCNTLAMRKLLLKTYWLPISAPSPLSIGSSPPLPPLLQNTLPHPTTTLPIPTPTEHPSSKDQQSIAESHVSPGLS